MTLFFFSFPFCCYHNGISQDGPARLFFPSYITSVSCFVCDCSEIFFSLFFCSPGSKGAEILPRLGNGSNPTSLCFLRIYDSTVPLHPQIFQHFTPASWANLLFYFLYANQLLSEEETHNIHFVCVFPQYLPGVIAFLPIKSPRSVGRVVGRSVTLYRRKSNNGFTFMFLLFVCLGRNQVRSSAAYRRINVFSVVMIFLAS